MTTRQQKARHASYSRRALHLYESSLPMNTTPPATPTIPDREQITPPPIYDDVVASALASDGLAAEVEAWLKSRSPR